MGHAGALARILGSLAISAAAARGQVTQLISVGAGGVPANGASKLPSISADGRCVVFSSLASNLVAGDTNAEQDVFLRDRIAGTTERINVDSNEVQGNGYCEAYWRAITTDNNRVVFYGYASNLVPGDTNASPDIFIRNRQNGTTERLSVSSAGVQANGFSQAPSISALGLIVAFQSSASNLVAGDTNGTDDIFVRNRLADTTQRISVSTLGVQANDLSFGTAISADGRYVAFQSYASNLVAGDVNGVADVFVRDRLAGTTELVSFTPSGGQFLLDPDLVIDISPDGGYVTFSSPGFTSTGSIYVHDRALAATFLVVAGGNSFGARAQFAGSGLFIAFISAQPHFPSDTNASNDVFVWDELAGTGARESVSTAGAQGDANSGVYAVGLSPDRRFVVYDGVATNLVAGDTNGVADIFIRDRTPTSFTSLCTPTGAVTACPCANPPAGPDRGCNNSSATGGASLSASGVASLLFDTFVFTTSGEKPTALSIVAQWVGENSAGVVFGQGVRCTSGTFKRLFSKNAVAGSITVPDFGAGDPTVSARSAAKGDTILAGQSRWYVVYYRDNTVLGGCPPTSTFNATQTGKVTWSP